MISYSTEGMSAAQLIYLELINRSIESLQRYNENVDFDFDSISVTKDNAEEIWDELREIHDDVTYEEMYEMREEGKPSNILTKHCSRHYEVDEVYYQVKTGEFVGWSYWHGGGKHAEPEAIDWISDSYILEVAEVKMIPEYTFKTKGVTP